MHIRKIIFEHSLNAVCGFSGAVFFFLDDDHQAKLESKKISWYPPTDMTMLTAWWEPILGLM